jgi:hypothetical protein
MSITVVPSIPVNTIVGIGLTKSCMGGFGPTTPTSLVIQPVTPAATPGSASLAVLPVASPVLATVAVAGGAAAPVPMFLSVPNTPVNYLRNNDIVNILSLSIQQQPYALAAVGTSVVWLGLGSITGWERPTVQWRVWVPSLPVGAPVPTQTDVTLIHVGSSPLDPGAGLALHASSSGSFYLAPPGTMCKTFVQFSSAASAIAADTTWVLPLWVNEWFSTWQQPAQWIPDWLPPPLRVPPPPGGDRDEHGCIPSAGYVWCPYTGRCQRPWEESCGPEPPGPPGPPGPGRCLLGTKWCPFRGACIELREPCVAPNPTPGPWTPAPNPTPGPWKPAPNPTPGSTYVPASGFTPGHAMGFGVHTLGGGGAGVAPASLHGFGASSAMGLGSLGTPGVFHRRGGLLF